MNHIQWQWFVLGTVLFYSVEGQKVCDFSDVECTTRGAKRIYKTLLAAFKESPDPIYQEKIEADLEVIKFKLANVTLEGMRKCDVQRLLCRPNEMTFDYDLLCPDLAIHANFELEGQLGTIPVDGKGETKITADNYLFLCTGTYEKFVSEEDKTPRASIKSFDIDADPKGKVTFQLSNLLAGDKDKFESLDAFLNENWMDMEKLFRQPILNYLFRKFFTLYSIALETIPLEQVLPMED